MSHPLSKEVPTAATYWVDRFQLEHNMDCELHRKKPEEPGDWVEVELAIVADVRARGRMLNRLSTNEYA